LQGILDEQVKEKKIAPEMKLLQTERTISQAPPIAQIDQVCCLKLTRFLFANSEQKLN